MLFLLQEERTNWSPVSIFCVQFLNESIFKVNLA